MKEYRPRHNVIKKAIEACQEVANGKVALSLKIDGRQARYEFWTRRRDE
jgi:hypothetical protein